MCLVSCRSAKVCKALYLIHCKCLLVLACSFGSASDARDRLGLCMMAMTDYVCLLQWFCELREYYMKLLKSSAIFSYWNVRQFCKVTYFAHSLWRIQGITLCNKTNIRKHIDTTLSLIGDNNLCRKSTAGPTDKYCAIMWTRKNNSRGCSTQKNNVH